MQFEHHIKWQIGFLLAPPLAGCLDQQLKAVDIDVVYPHQLSTTPHFWSFRNPNLLTLTLSPKAGRTDRTCSSCTSRRSETTAAELLKLPTPQHPGGFGVSLTHDPYTCTRFCKIQLRWGHVLVFQCRSVWRVLTTTSRHQSGLWWW